MNLEGFNLTARTNLEHAADRLEQSAERERVLASGDKQVAIADENAVATIRELLKLPGGAYGAEQ